MIIIIIIVSDWWIKRGVINTVVLLYTEGYLEDILTHAKYIFVDVPIDILTISIIFQ